MSLTATGSLRHVTATAGIALMLAVGAVPATPRAADRSAAASADKASAETARTTVPAYRARASKLLGKDVYNPGEEKLGSIDDLVIAEKDEAIYAVLSVGGFLGIGDKLVIVQFDRIKGSSQGRLLLDVD